MSEGKYTPTPWEVSQAYDSESNKTTVAIYHKPNQHSYVEVVEDGIPVSQADAEFIVSAVNSYATHQQELSAARGMIADLIEFATHEEDCASIGWQAGEPTPDGGYRTKIRGKWYESKPVNKHPKCSCGVDELYAKASEFLKADAAGGKG